MKKLKTPQDVQRRQFLKTAGQSGISAALLKSMPLAAGLMYSRAGLAAPSASGFERVVFVYIPDGAPKGSYTPTGSLGNLIMNSTSMPLDAYKDDCMFFSDCKTNAGKHGNTELLLGRGNNTLDVQLEKTIGAASAFPSIQLGVESAGPVMTKRAGAFAPMQNDPDAAFKRLFGGTVDTSDAGLKRSQTILDRNRAELNTLKQKLGSFELERLEETEIALQTLELRLADNNMPITGCADYTRTPYAGALLNNFAQINALQCETIAMAFRCNLTKIASLQLGGTQADHYVPSLSTEHSYHQSIHGGPDGLYTKMRSHLTEQLAELVRVLKTTKDGNDKPLLDTTLILQVTDMGDGRAHDAWQAPFTLITSNPSIVTGRVFSGANNDDLLNTVAYAMGAEGEVTDFGGVGRNSDILS
ncbi:MAG: DUF1552 domain-containing protein [Saccharospirillaceae bacterium]|nr:DUF1552 domain-containing protein [Pseudomonadales bacterium]NRB77578.1 DUF1552 domain-containing protein [Saccharospirillaceae bacterium]